MSVIEVTMFSIVCDNCGQEGVAESDFAGWNDKDWTLDEAFEAGWIEHNHYHYCPKCFELDDDDNISIKTPKS